MVIDENEEDKTFEGGSVYVMFGLDFALASTLIEVMKHRYKHEY